MKVAAVLEARRITKRFGGVQALRDVSFDLRPGEVHALCGENGAGKSTLIKVLSGSHPYDTYDGEVRIQGRIARFHDVRDSQRHGLAIVHQELALVDNLTVAENILLGRFPMRGPRIDWQKTMILARKVLEAYEVPIRPDVRVAELGIGQRQLVEIARALSRSADVLLLDEPTAALSAAETKLLLDQVCRLREAGVACIYVSHKLEEVMHISDRITVLRDGTSVGTFARGEVDMASLIHLMVGRQIRDIYPERQVMGTGCIALEVNQLSAESPLDHHVSLKEISLRLHAGEILGIGGLMGAGRSELLMNLYGLWGRTTGGKVTLQGQRYDARSPQASIQRGMMMVTENRRKFGLIPGQSTQHNLSLSSLAEVTRFGFVRREAEQGRNDAMLKKLHFRSLHAAARVEHLSGGNQQKVVIGRGLLTQPVVVLLDEPTRGIDVGAKREVCQEINRLAAEGKAILLVSSELAELMGICDRILIMHEGQVIRSFNRSEFAADELLAAAFGKV